MLKNKIILISISIVVLGLFSQYQNKLRTLENEKRQLEIKLKNSITEIEVYRAIELKNRENLKNLYNKISKINEKYDEKKNFDDDINAFIGELQSRTRLRTNKSDSK